MRDAPSSEYARLYVHSVPALAPLSRDSAASAMKRWNETIYDDPTFNQIMLSSCGVPRHLQFAFQVDGELARSSTEIALNEISRCFEESYKSTAPLFSEDAQTALAIVLCSAVRWTATGSRQFDRVPGTNTPCSPVLLSPVSCLKVCKEFCLIQEDKTRAAVLRREGLFRENEPLVEDAVLALAEGRNPPPNAAVRGWRQCALFEKPQHGTHVQALEGNAVPLANFHSVAVEDLQKMPNDDGGNQCISILCML